VDDADFGALLIACDDGLDLCTATLTLAGGFTACTIVFLAGCTDGLAGWELSGGVPTAAALGTV
jgi:hypothetical protein